MNRPKIPPLVNVSAIGLADAYAKLVKECMKNGALVYAKRFSSDIDKIKGYHAEGKLAVADMLTMIQMLCITLNWNFDELRKLGVEHLRERQHEFIEQKWKDTQ